MYCLSPRIFSKADGLFSAGSLDVITELPVLRIIGLGTSKTPASANDAFNVQTGVKRLTGSGTGFLAAQPVSAAGGPIEVLLNSSDQTVGELTTLAQTGAVVTVQVPVGAIQSPDNLALNGVEFNTQATGATTVSATALDFDPLAIPAASVTVTVSP